VILTYCSNQQQKTRIGLITSRSFGKANVRNRGRRILRAAIQQLATLLQPGWDIVLIARAPLATSTSAGACLVLKNACQKAGLLRTGIDEKPVWVYLDSTRKQVAWRVSNLALVTNVNGILLLRAYLICSKNHSFYSFVVISVLSHPCYPLPVAFTPLAQNMPTLQLSGMGLSKVAYWLFGAYYAVSRFPKAVSTPYPMNGRNIHIRTSGRLPHRL